MDTISLALRAEDAEPILRNAAEEAAKFGALLDYTSRKTRMVPYSSAESYDDARKRWHQKFVRAKRMVEAFGVEYEPTSEGEALTVTFDMIKQKRKIINLGPPLGRVAMRSGGEPDYKHPWPSWRGGVHEEAVRHAAERVVRRWRETIR